jgi:nucleotide-binding universal stress UspA family protein
MTTHGTELITPALKEIGKAGSELLAKAKRKVEEKGVKVETLFKGGHVVEQILAACKEGESDLIVMGARGISSIAELILGSVSHGVIKHVNTPVLVVR